MFAAAHPQRRTNNLRSSPAAIAEHHQKGRIRALAAGRSAGFRAWLSDGLSLAVGDRRRARCQIRDGSAAARRRL